LLNTVFSINEWSHHTDACIFTVIFKISIITHVQLKELPVEFYHLRSFVAVAQTGNLTQAAKRLYTTPPAISAHIKTLEDELNTPLFVRSSKGMALTDKGKLLLTKAQVTLDSAVDLVNLAAENQHEIIGNFNLATNVATEQLKLSELADNIQASCPGISLAIQPQSTGKTLNDLRESSIDGGYIFGDIPDDLVGITVLEQTITTIAPVSFDVNSIATKADLASQPWIKMGDYCPFDQRLSQLLGSNVPSVLKTSDDGTRLALVASGLGLSFIEIEAALLAQQNQQVQIIPLLDFTLPLQFVVAKHRASEPVIATFKQIIAQLWC